ncbi:MAG: hypothetical protein JXJ04_02690, partial [Spirochaetales bacterium]|nr:hypothetical protein [Spirochaetales bacterium]
KEKFLEKFEISNVSDQSNYEIDVEFTAMDDSITRLYSVKFNKKYYLKPGDYKYTIFIKNLLLSQSNITIVKGFENKIWISF